MCQGDDYMTKKVILISIDGMRSDGLMNCGNPYLNELKKICRHTFQAKAMFPPVTSPCHFSMTHSVTPQRHGILSNTFIPQVHPITGLFEQINASGGVSAMFYGWEPIKDIASPGSLKFSTYINAYMYESCDTILTNVAEKLIEEHEPDFVFLYMVETDEKGGHDNGWMSDEYLKRIFIAIENVKKIIEKFKDDYSVIIMSDHGGHDRTHGADISEDMTIPLFFYGPDFTPGENISNATLLDIAPTIVDIMGINPVSQWEGQSIICKKSYSNR